MSIQWFPGHMTKARKVLAEALPAQDVVIEVLDARLPSASENPMLAELRAQKPCVKVLSKADLADPEVTDAWVAHYDRKEPALIETAHNGWQRAGEVRAVAVRQDRAAETRQKIFALCKELVEREGRDPKKTVRAFVVGVPNVGKSTLVNTLIGRKVAKVGDIPAVTRGKQIVTLDNGIVLADSPGVMWPKIEDAHAGLRLAFAGSIPDTAIDLETVAAWGARWLATRYADALCARYKLAALPDPSEEGAAFGVRVLEAVGRKRGALRAGGVIDLHKASEVLIHDYRSGVFGRVSLESPPKDQ